MSVVEPLPAVDDHVRAVAATPERTWRALVAVLGGGRPLPRPLTAAWGLTPPARSGAWGGPTPGSTIPGFAVAAADPPRALTLHGGHRFSRYELRFTLVPVGPDRLELHARTAAAFPGPHGRVYRALVIGSGGHVLAVRGLLARVARRAEGPRGGPPPDG
jgi:hypothetical protein